jgi:SH3-like domain-containing protein
VTAPNGLIIREAPSTSAYILAYVNKDDIVWLTGVKETNEGINWDQIVAPDGGIGWVSTRYLEVINP